MTDLVLLTSADCHLCNHGEHVLDQLAREGLVSWRAVDDATEPGRALARSAPPLRPVLFRADGRVLAYGRLSSRRLRRQLARAGSRA